MFKSSITKIMMTVIVIIIISFLILSGIVNTFVRSYVTNIREATLERACKVVRERLVSTGEIQVRSEQELREYLSGNNSMYYITDMALANETVDIILTDPKGEILFFSEEKDSKSGSNTTIDIHIPLKESNLDLENIDLSAFDSVSDEEDILYCKRTLHLTENSGSNQAILYAAPITAPRTGDMIGYAIAYTYTLMEDDLIVQTRDAVFQSTLWVMLAALIAVYFVTDHIITPLREMTVAAKKFAKGDFTDRIAVKGQDEVAVLGKTFNNMAESLDNLEKMRNSFLANVSHDLRTPMTTILGFIDGINSGAIPPEKQSYYLGVISAEVHRLSRLVSELLDISRLESGDRKFTFTDFDIAEVGRLILISFEQKIEDKQLDVMFDSDEDEMLVHADKDAIYQVLYNLCHNAIKFSSEKGKFEIKIHRIGQEKIEVSVFDEGQVIADEDLPFVFDRFYKTDKSRGLDKNGVGLGLYICKTIVDAHGEEIHVETDAAKTGCRFFFTLKESTAAPKKRNLAALGDGFSGNK